jgi:hypothetical protein
MTKKSEFVSKVDFRWRQHEEDYATRLSESATEAGRSVGDQARELIKNALSRSDLLEHAVETLRQEVAQLFKQLRDLSTIKEGMKTLHENVYESRDDLVTCIVKVLVDAGRLTPQAAEDWAKKTFDAE